MEDVLLVDIMRMKFKSAFFGALIMHQDLHDSTYQKNGMASFMVQFITNHI